MEPSAPIKRTKREQNKPCTTEEVAVLFLASREYEGEQSAFFNPYAFQKEWLFSILLVHNVYSDPNKSIQKACKMGHVELLRSLLFEGYPITTHAFVDAAETESTDCLNMLLDYASPRDRRVCNHAINHGRTLHVEILLARGAPADSGSCMWASIKGNLKCLRLLVERGIEPDKNSTEYASDYGHLDCLQYLVSIGTRIKPRAIAIAAAHNHIECVRFLLDVKAPIDECCAAYPTHHDLVDMLRFLIDRGVPLSPDLCRVAHHWGGSKCLRLLVERKLVDYEQYIHIVEK